MERRKQFASDKEDHIKKNPNYTISSTSTEPFVIL